MNREISVSSEHEFCSPSHPVAEYTAASARFRRRVRNAVSGIDAPHTCPDYRVDSGVAARTATRASRVGASAERSRVLPHSALRS